MLTPQSRQMADDFLSWLEQERIYTIKLFKVWCIVQDSLQKQWEENDDLDDHTLRWLKLSREKCKELEHLLNVIDFGGDYGINFETPARKALFMRWATMKNTIPQN